MTDPVRALLDQFQAQSPIFRSMLEIAAKVACHDIPLLLEGETGVGKERLARAIHFSSPRREGEFVILDCSSFSEPILECEFFGYVRGSFVGAIHDKNGLLELAHGGTVFLDHISKMTHSFQGKLVRLMEEGTFHRIGGVAAIPANVRFIAATSQDLKPLVARAEFREDLYYRLNVMRLTLPPLRERREDILVLADQFLDHIAARDGGPKKELAKSTKSALEAYDWPGNVRELEEEMEKSVILAAESRLVRPEHFSPEIGQKRGVLAHSKRRLPAGSLKEQKRQLIASLEKNAIMEALTKTSGNKTRAAQALAISRQELFRKISTYRIKSS